MRARLSAILTVLALAALAAILLAAPASAASGLPSTITMNPAQAGPGSQVEVLGLDFPVDSTVELLLTTTAGALPLGTASTGEGGYFRQLVTFPADVTPGFWELRAQAPSGAVAVHIFEAASPGALGASGRSAGDPRSAQGSAAPGGAIIDPNLVVLLVLGLLIAGVAGAASFVWLQTHKKGEPGMPTGDDPIWSGAGGDSN